MAVTLPADATEWAAAWRDRINDRAAFAAAAEEFVDRGVFVGVGLLVEPVLVDHLGAERAEGGDDERGHGRGQPGHHRRRRRALYRRQRRRRRRLRLRAPGAVRCLEGATGG